MPDFARGMSDGQGLRVCGGLLEGRRRAVRCIRVIMPGAYQVTREDQQA